MAKIEEFRGKSPDELKEEVLKLKKELFNLRFQVSSGELQNTGRFRTVRRDIARIKTALNEPKDAHLPAKKTKAPKVKKASEHKAAAPKAEKAAKEPKAKKTSKKKAGE